MADLSRVVAARVRARRLELGMTQAKLAEAAGVSVELVSRIERGRCLPSLQTFVTLAEVLQTTPNGLLDSSTDRRGPREIDAIVDAVQRLPNARRREIRRIAEALAQYGRRGED